MGSLVFSMMLTSLCLSLLLSLFSGAEISDTLYCNDCTEVTVASTGLVSETVPQLLGVYQVAGSIHEDLFPFWQSEAGGAYLTTDPISDPQIQWWWWLDIRMAGMLGSKMGMMFSTLSTVLTMWRTRT